MAFAHIYAAQKFDKADLVKRELVTTEHLHVGLLCIEPGQGQKAHSHADLDKVYYVHEGVATVTVAGETSELGPGALAVAKAGAPHEVWNKGRDRLTVVVFVAPPPREHAKH